MDVPGCEDRVGVTRRMSEYRGLNYDIKLE